MKWFKFSGMLVPSNMVFFIEDEEEGNKKWEWVGNLVMARVNEETMEEVINFVTESDEALGAPKIMYLTT